jgi:hypothetical protein
MSNFVSLIAAWNNAFSNADLANMQFHIQVGQALFIPSPSEGLPVLVCCGKITEDRREYLSYLAN